MLEEGQWLEIETLTEGTIRAQLALKNEQEQRLVFTNMAGIKAADYSFVKFDELMSLKRVTALHSGGGFSLCLAAAAGIDTSEKLDELYAFVTGEQQSENSADEERIQCPPLKEPEEDLASYLAKAIAKPKAGEADTVSPIQPLTDEETSKEKTSQETPSHELPTGETPSTVIELKEESVENRGNSR